MIEKVLVQKVQGYIREHRLLEAGERVAAAVSGGADSVALLRVLLELREELGIVLKVAHFNHRIRGAAAEADEQFVRALAEKSGLEFFCGSADTPAYAREQKLSLETAARELRHQWFAQLVESKQVDKIATAHTEDDQAETVLMRLVRGTGTRGLAGISPIHSQKALVRPMLSIARAEVEAYLNHLGQSWHEDHTNQDLRHARNRVRHELLPELERNYNPQVRRTLADLAEVARAEEDYWQGELAALMERHVHSGKPSRSGRSHDINQPLLAVDLAGLRGLPLAVQRRLLRAMAERLGASLEFKHVEELLALALQGKGGKSLVLADGLVARMSHRELSLGRENPKPSSDYRYSLQVPGEVVIPELGTRIRAQVVSLSTGNHGVSGYNAALLLARALLAPELTVRNWRAGDRFFPAHSRFPKKVKELLQSGRLHQDLSTAERKTWPVIESAGEIIWMRGFPVPQAFAANSGDAVLIEETSGSGTVE